MTDASPKIGFLALFFDLYLRSGADLFNTETVFANDLRQVMEKTGQVVFPGLCSNREEIDLAVRQFEQENCDIMVVVFTTYCPSLYALPALLHTQIPIVLFNTQRLYAITPDLPITAPTENHGVHGVQDLANVLRRSGRAFQVVTGHWEDPAARVELEDWIKAAASRSYLQSTRIGLLGFPMEDMGDFGLDQTGFLAQMGVHINHIPMRLVADQAAAAPASEIASQIEFDRQHFSIAKDVTPEQHETASRLEWGLRSVLLEWKLAGFASHFLAVGNEKILDSLPFLASSKLLAEGFGFGGEGDVTSATAVALLNHLYGEANFTEIFTMDFGGGHGYMSHMGEGNWRMARPGEPVELLVNPFKLVPLKQYPISLRFALKSGPVTLLSLTCGANGKVRFIITEGSIADQPAFANIIRTHSLFKPAKPLPQFLNEYALAGGSHHMGMVYGSAASRLVKLARLMNIEFEII